MHGSLSAVIRLLNLDRPRARRTIKRQQGLREREITLHYVGAVPYIESRNHHNMLLFNQTLR